MKDLDLNIFPPLSKQEWKQLAEKQLKGANPDQELRWKNEAEIELEGYYDTSDLASLKYLEDFFTSIKPHRWKLYEEVEVKEAKYANEQILKALMGGCDGVILNITEEINIEKALIDVDTSICDISIKSDQKISTSNLSGFHIMPGGNCYQAIESIDPIGQIKGVLSNIENQAFIYRTSFQDFFLEIASVRALRFLLGQKGSNAQIHSHVPLHNSDEHQWFLNTTAGLASILGGSHSVDFSTAIGDPRISRNTSNLIREESGIEEYHDQCGGSYYIEVLTDKIIKGVEKS